MYFVCAPAQFVIRRQRRSKLRNPRIEKRRAHFQRHRHARPINFRQYVFGQVKLRVDTLHAFHELVGITFIPHRACVAVDVVVA